MCAAPNAFGSNLTKSIIVQAIDPTGTPYGPDNPFPVDLVIDPSDGIATSANQTLQLAVVTTPGTSPAKATAIQGFGFTGTCTVTRAANQTPYTGGDVVGGALTIATVGPAGGGEIFIDGLRLMPNLTALPSGMGGFSLYLYNVTPPSAIADNSPFTMGSGDRAAFLGRIDGLTVANIGTGTVTPYGSLNYFLGQFTVPSGGTLYGYLVTLTGYTPAANSETYTLTVKSITP